MAQKSTMTPEQLRWLLNEEAEGNFGPEGLGPILQWFADNRPTVDGLRMGKLKLAQFPCQIHAAGIIPKDSKGRPWEVVEDVAPTITPATIMDFVSHLKKKESYLVGDDLRPRAVELRANLGLSDGKVLLDNQDKMIPESVRGKLIILTGTVLRDPGGDLSVACLYWLGGRWVLDWLWLGINFSVSCVLPRGK